MDLKEFAFFGLAAGAYIGVSWHQAREIFGSRPSDKRKPLSEPEVAAAQEDVRARTAKVPDLPRDLVAPR